MKQTKNQNPAFSVLTVPLPNSFIQKIDKHIKEGNATSRTDFIKTAILFYYHYILDYLFKSEIKQIQSRKIHDNPT